VQPDFALVYRHRSDVFRGRYLHGAPDLIIEVLSPPYPELDTHVKHGSYVRAGVPESWIVQPATRDVLVCWQPESALGNYAQIRLIGPDSELGSTTLPIRLMVADLFADAPNTIL